MFLLAFLIVLFILYFFHGSLEMFPTEEQQEKVRIISLSVIFFLICLEWIIFFIQKRIKGNIKNLQ